MKDLKPIDYGIFAELVKNARLSDRQLAKILNVSQPTITRRRNELEKRGLLDYTAILDIRKLGFETSLSYEFFSQLKKMQVTLVPLQNIVEELRKFKDQDELKNIKIAHLLFKIFKY